ncbi:MAG: GAF domain-containing protein, partial [Myxococcales bacterium]|nr:GAF domain-containing protein [Myxococcales bacterium]
DGPKLWFYSASVIRALYHLIMGEPEQTLALLDAIPDYPRVMLGSWSVPRAAMIHAVAAASCHGRSDERERRRLERRIDRSAKLLRRWAVNCPENYGHLLALVLAEREALLGDHVQALTMFERARTQAESRRCFYAAALACERMAAHTLAREQTTLANGALQDAWALYRRWGARAKLQLLGQVHGLGEQRNMLVFESVADSSSMSFLDGDAPVDLDALTSSLAAIAEELEFDAVVRKALEAAMSNGGADRGALLLDGESGLGLVALGSSGRRVQVLAPPLELASAAALVPLALVEHMLATETMLIVDDARVDPRFAREAYVERTGVRSLLCMPLGKPQRRLGVLVLENRQRTACFSEQRLQLLTLVATQASGTIDNANLYRALRRSEVQWRSLVDGAPDLIALLDTNGELTFVNRPVAGWVVGRPPAIEPDTAEPWRNALEAALEHGRRGEVEVSVQRSGSGLRWFDAHIAPVDLEGEARRVMIIATEITERKLADARRLELEATLRQQQRLESIGTLA